MVTLILRVRMVLCAQRNVACKGGMYSGMHGAAYRAMCARPGLIQLVTTTGVLHAAFGRDDVNPWAPGGGCLHPG